VRTRTKAGAALLAVLALGACSVEEADEPGSSSSDEVAAENTDLPDTTNPSDINEMAFDITWDGLTGSERAVLCDAGHLLGWDEAGNQISIGSGRSISADQASNLLQNACLGEGL
jgi:hypothetical protein